MFMMSLFSCCTLWELMTSRPCRHNDEHRCWYIHHTPSPRNKKKTTTPCACCRSILSDHSNSAGITLTSSPSSVAPPLNHCHHVSSPPSYDSEELAKVLLILERNFEKVVDLWSRSAGQMLELACSVSQLAWRSSHHPFINWLAQHSVQHQPEIFIPTHSTNYGRPVRDQQPRHVPE